jgi:two-component system CheB/CheR fusion protein
LGERSLPVFADPTRLAQITTNLLTNVTKFTPAAGTIELVAREETEQAVLSIRDNAIGIAPEMLPRVFDMFAQADTSLDRAGGGLGVGLTLVKRLIEVQGGKSRLKVPAWGRVPTSGFVCRCCTQKTHSLTSRACLAQNTS